MVMAIFALVNSIVFIVTLLFVPSMPVKEKLSYGAQLSVLTKSITWLSIVSVIFMNAAIFGVYSYLVEYLKAVMKMSPNTISLTLFIYGGANIIGNIMAGKLLAKNAIKSVIVFPIILGAIYIFLFFAGPFPGVMTFFILIWGILCGIGANINQFWIVSSAPEAPDFANGLFLTSANLGVTLGSAIGGFFISEIGTQFLVLVGILSSVLGLVTILLRTFKYNRIKLDST